MVVLVWNCFRWQQILFRCVFVLLTLSGHFSLLVSVHAESVFPQRPNIIFVLCDDLGYGDISPFGQKRFRTPNLDKLAAEGQKWTHHYASSPVCVPSRACLMLGKHTGHSPIRDHQFDRALPELADAPTIASVLKSAGYATFSVGKWGIGGGKEDMPAHPEKRGFDHWFGLYGHADGHVHYPDSMHPIFEGTKNVTPQYENSYSTDLYTAKAKEFIAKHTKKNPNQPFFLYLAYIAPHFAYQVPDGPYPSNGVNLPLKANPSAKDAWIDPALPANWSDWEKRYATMIRRLDAAMGDLTNTLAKQGLDKNTLIVFTSDNGPAMTPAVFNSWGPFDGFKRDLYEGGIRAPTILWGPGIVKPGEVSVPSAHYDWLTTFAELAGTPTPKDTDGISLVPSVTGKGTQIQHDLLYFEFHGASNEKTDHEVLGRHGFPVIGPDPWGEQQAVRIGNFVGLRAQIHNARTPLKLYDLVADPRQEKDLAADPTHSTLKARMMELMVSEHTPQLGNARPYGGKAKPKPLTQTSTKPGISVLSGRTYTPPDFTNQAPKWFGSSVQDNPTVELLVTGLTPGKERLLGISWWDWGGRGRKQLVRVCNLDGSAEMTLIPETMLPDWKGKKQRPSEILVELPPSLTESAFRIFVDCISGPNALACEIWIYEASERKENDNIKSLSTRLDELRQSAPQGFQLLYYEDL